MRRAGILVALLLLSVGVRAGEAPTLTDADRSQIVSTLQRLEIAQLRAQLAQVAFDRAKTDAETVLKSFQRPGYVLNLDSLKYEPTKESSSDK